MCWGVDLPWAGRRWIAKDIFLAPQLLLAPPTRAHYESIRYQSSYKYKSESSCAFKSWVHIIFLFAVFVGGKICTRTQHIQKLLAVTGVRQFFVSIQSDKTWFCCEVLSAHSIVNCAITHFQLRSFSPQVAPLFNYTIQCESFIIICLFQ